mgnify:CR=1 FL=1
MEIIETQRHRSPDRTELRLFLEACRDEAIEDAHYKIASISIKTRQLDPLAVLESIYERGERHFYFENVAQGWALAGAEAIVEGLFEGENRVALIQKWADEVLEHTIAVGDLNEPFSGPHFYAGIGFEATASPGALFAGATVFLPRWQVAQKEGATLAVANFRIDADGDLDALTEKLWAAYAKFNQFDYSEVPTAAPKQLIRSEEVGSEMDYETRVAMALKQIRSGRYEKIVMARAMDMTFNAAFNPLTTLNGLRQRFRDCYALSFENTEGQSFVAASPERLVRVENGNLETEALAGSIGRGVSAAEDARKGKKLLASEKDLREHQHVVDSIERRLKEIDVVLERPKSPELLVLANVQHLRTRLRASVGDRHILDAVNVLHPTPAVGGTPREAAVEDIAIIEPFERGLYAGAIGYFDHKGAGEFCVGLRAGIVNGLTARVFAGAGIVEGSVPAAEKRETEMKMGALADALRML